MSYQDSVANTRAGMLGVKQYAEERVCDVPVECRMSSGEEFLNELVRVAERAERLDKWANDRLSGVMQPQNKDTGRGICPPQRVYPPMLDSYRALLVKMESALIGIEEALERVDI